MQDLITSVDEHRIAGCRVDDGRIDEYRAADRARHGHPGHAAVVRDHTRRVGGELRPRCDRTGCRRSLDEEGHLYAGYGMSISVADIGDDAILLLAVGELVVKRFPDEQ